MSAIHAGRDITSGHEHTAKILIVLASTWF